MDFGDLGVGPEDLGVGPEGIWGSDQRDLGVERDLGVGPEEFPKFLKGFCLRGRTKIEVN